MSDYMIRLQLEGEDDYADVHEKMAARDFSRFHYEKDVCVVLPTGTYMKTTSSSIDSVLMEILWVILEIKSPAQVVVSGGGKIRTFGLKSWTEELRSTLRAVISKSKR